MWRRCWFRDPSGHQAIPGVPAPPPSLDWLQVIEMAEGLSVVGGPEVVAVTTAVAVGSVGAVYGSAWAMQDMGPDYQVAVGYDPSAVQSSFALPNAGTLAIDTATVNDPLDIHAEGSGLAARDQGSLVIPAKINPEGNRGERPWSRPDGQNFHKNPQEEKPKEAPFGDPRPKRMGPEQTMIPPAEDVLKNLRPDQVGWGRFLLAKMVELVDAIMGNGLQ